MRHIITPDWVAEGYSFPHDVKVTHCDDLGELPKETLASADYVVLPYLGSSIDLETAFAQMENVEVIQTITAGFNHVQEIAPKTATLCNAAGVHDVATSEMAVMLALSSLRQLPRSVLAQQRHDWDDYFSESLWNKNVLLIGYGEVGKATYKRLEPFGCHLTPVATHAREGVRAITDLNDLLPNAEVVILTVPLNESTHHLINAERLQLMKDGALLVNVARGAVVDTEALLLELSSGRLRAAVDVTDPEPLPKDHPLWSAQNTLIVAHLGGDTDAFAPRARIRIHRQWDLWLAGQPLECVIPH